MKTNRDEDAAENLLKYANSFNIDKDKFADTNIDSGLDYNYIFYQMSEINEYR